MTETPLILAIPSKGRLQENCTAYLERAGMRIVQERGARDYRAAIAGMADIEVLLLSASEIAGELAAGTIHLGVTGEDLVRENIARSDEKVVMVAPLGFGYANVVVAVPQAWIDVRSMADIEDVAAGFRARHGRRLRVATKYITLTRAFFAAHGVGDYLIVESLGATEGAPATGAADLIVDITTTGSTLSANALKIIDDGVILRSQANLVASLVAPWSQRARSGARALLARLSARARAAGLREVRCAWPGLTPDLSAAALDLFGATLPYGRPEGGQPAVLHVGTDRLFDFAAWLIANGGSSATVSTVDLVFDPDNTLMSSLAARLPA